MTAAATDLAFRTAMTAGPFADSLCSDVAWIADALRQGELHLALQTLESSTDRLQRFLTFLVVASELLAEVHPSLGFSLAHYNRRLFDITGQIEDDLDAQDLFGLSITLEQRLARALSEYGAYESDVRRALSPRQAA